MSAFHSPEWNRSIHTTSWYCNIDHDMLEFDIREELVDHLKQGSSHPQRPKPTKTQLQALVKAKRRIQIRDRYVCPLCDCIPDKIKHVISSSTDQILMDLLNDHVAQHLLVMAFISVPWPDTTDAAEHEAVDSKNEGSDGTRKTFLLEPDCVPTSALFEDTVLADEDADVGNTTGYVESDIHLVPTVPETNNSHWSHFANDNPDFAHLRQFNHDQQNFEDPPPSLGDKFLSHLERSKFGEKQEFLPEGYLDRLFTRQALKDDLFVDKVSFDAEDEKLIDFITRSAKKVFATAYCVLGSGGSALLPTMMYFQSIGFSDKALPIENLQTVGRTRDAQREVPFPFNRNRNITLRRTWAPMRIRNFYQSQWMFLAPVFSRGHFHHILSPDVVLPFIWVNNVTKGGRFSKVYEVEIHECHQQLLDAKV